MHRAGLMVALCLAACQSIAAPAISIIIDDLGNQIAPGERAVNLPGPLAMSILPDTPYAKRLAIAAHARHKEVLLHLPMQAMGKRDVAAGVIALETSRDQLVHVLTHALAAVPYACGVNNHMGSLITRHPGHMSWLMEALAVQGDLFFVDSRTTPDSVAYRMAREKGIPALQRDVFLDNNPSPQAIQAAFDRLIAIARRDGDAIAIGHPYPATLGVLEQRLPELEGAGVELISLQRMLERQRRSGSFGYSAR